VTCTALKGAILCDVGKEESKRPHPMKLVEFPTFDATRVDVPKPLKLPHIPPTSVEFEETKNRGVIQRCVFSVKPLKCAD
jgi:hypothetical protein